MNFGHKSTCDMHAFNYGDTIFINVSIFQYNIDFIAQSDKFLYANVPLGATCSLICYGVKVDTTQMSVESIVCPDSQSDKQLQLTNDLLDC